MAAPPVQTPTTAGRAFPPHPSTLSTRPRPTAHHVTRAPNAPSSGSQTITQTQPQSRPHPVLRLRGEDTGEATDENSRRGIRWAEDVVDNEGLGRKSSKVCCIYHAPRNIDSSSDESSSDSSDSDSDSGDDGSARPVGGKKAKKHTHDHGKDCDHDGGKAGKGKGRSRSPNAYEKMPAVKKAGGGMAGS